MVGVKGNGPCVFPRRQVDARDVVVMRSFGEQIQDVLSSLQSRIKSSSTRIPGLGCLGNRLRMFSGCPCGNGSLRVACP